MNLESNPTKRFDEARELLEAMRQILYFSPSMAFSPNSALAETENLKKVLARSGVAEHPTTGVTVVALVSRLCVEDAGIQRPGQVTFVEPSADGTGRDIGEAVVNISWGDTAWLLGGATLRVLDNGEVDTSEHREGFADEGYFESIDEDIRDCFDLTRARYDAVISTRQLLGIHRQPNPHRILSGVSAFFCDELTYELGERYSPPASVAPYC